MKCDICHKVMNPIDIRRGHFSAFSEEFDDEGNFIKFTVSCSKHDKKKGSK